jgi:hypothetical protein
MTFDNCYTIANGASEPRSLSLLLARGSGVPDFVFMSIPDRNINPRKAVITESEGCTLKKVNNMTCAKYFDSIGLPSSMWVDSTSVPLMVRYEGAADPVALVIYKLNEDGSALCGGEMPVGATFSMGDIDNAGIIETARAAAEKILSLKRAGGALVFPCVSRPVMLAPESEQEIKLVTDALGGSLPYLMGYAGGEICPVPDKNGKLHNRLHSYSFSACVF